MFLWRAVTRSLFVSIGSAAMLAGCATTPTAPTVQAVPGRGKTVEQFQAENTYCRGYAANQVKGQVDSANSRVVGSMLVTTGDPDYDSQVTQGAMNDAVAGQSNIQQGYDLAFAWCMTSEGDTVPGYTPPRATRAASHAPRRVITHAPAGAAAATATAPAGSNWVAPTTSSSSGATPVSSPASSSTWVAPVKNQ